MRLPSKSNRSEASSYLSPRRSHGVLNKVEHFHDSLWRFSPWVLVYLRRTSPRESEALYEKELYG